jgi:hypothetical protein
MLNFLPSWVTPEFVSQIASLPFIAWILVLGIKLKAQAKITETLLNNHIAHEFADVKNGLKEVRDDLKALEGTIMAVLFKRSN